MRDFWQRALSLACVSSILLAAVPALAKTKIDCRNSGVSFVFVAQSLKTLGHWRIQLNGESFSSLKPTKKAVRIAQYAPIHQGILIASRGLKIATRALDQPGNPSILNDQIAVTISQGRQVLFQGLCHLSYDQTDFDDLEFGVFNLRQYDGVINDSEETRRREREIYFKKKGWSLDYGNPDHEREFGNRRYWGMNAPK